MRYEVRAARDELILVLAASYLDQFSSHHVQRLLAGVEADAVAIAGKLSLDYFGLPGRVREGYENQSYRLLGCPAGRSGNSGDADAESRLTPFTDTLGERNCDWLADCAMLGNHQRRHVTERRFQIVVIDHRAAEKISGTSTHAGDALGQ